MKVFGIGMNKTATTSLGQACRKLGLTVLHDAQAAREICAALPAGQSHPKFDSHQVLLDGPYWKHYRWLDQNVPDARFILTVRDREQFQRLMKLGERPKAARRVQTAARFRAK